jgi:molybdenum ABC transporter molybdate-binding protein
MRSGRPFRRCLWGDDEMMNTTSQIWKAALVLTLSGLGSSPAWAWGERGHDVITRVAAREVAREAPGLGTSMVDREHMLSHLANVPDIVWRSGDQATREANGPTHFFDADYVDPSATNLPRDLKVVINKVRELCSKQKSCTFGPNATDQQILDKVGTAPWRIAQIHQKMTDALRNFARLQTSAASRDKLNSTWDEALLWAGLLSHFVGDLSQPLHTTKNYDGWENGHGGIHAWFETLLVSHLGLELDVDVANRTQLRLSKTKEKHAVSALDIALELASESWSQLTTLWTLDRNAIVKKGQISPEGVKAPAERIQLEKVDTAYEKFAIDRLSVGASTLARLWIKAWQDAGSPDMRSVSTWTYPVAPAFVPFDAKDFLATTKASPSTTITVGAAASMRNALEELESRHPMRMIKAKMTFGASSTLASQINSGAPIDIIVSADRATIDKLGSAVDEKSRLIIARGQLVLAARRGWWTQQGPFEFSCITRSDCPVKKIGSAHPAVPVGAYAREAIQSLGDASTIKAKIVPFEHVRAGLAALATGAVDASFAYKTDLEDAAKGRFEVLTDLTPRLKTPVVWEAAVVSASRNKNAANEWLKMLGGEEARKILSGKGFEVP